MTQDPSIHAITSAEFSRSTKGICLILASQAGMRAGHLALDSLEIADDQQEGRKPKAVDRPRRGRARSLLPEAVGPTTTVS